MNVMKAIDSGPDVTTGIVDYNAANRALENLKNALASHRCYEEAFGVSEMLRELDRIREQHVL
jgi:hypothetical protein